MSITLDQVRAEALFASDLQPSQHPPPELVRRSVIGVLRRFGSLWCAARMAQEFGDHPELAAERMAWAVRVVHDCYARTRPRKGCYPGRGPLPWRSAGSAHGRCRYPTGRYRHAVGRG